MEHAHWIYERLDSFRKFRNTCSNCKWSAIDNYDGYVDIDSFIYCPNCGAKMDEEGDNEKQSTAESKEKQI